jgi:uncharacterized protein YcbK (DUF882 family)
MDLEEANKTSKTWVSKRMASTAVAVALLANFISPSDAAGENRIISLYHVNTKERLTVTYMNNGRYIPSALKQLNYFLRDWRRNEVVAIDPKMIDLVWELHADLGSKVPINIVSGYRSAATNGFLKRIGRGVAKKSQHILGKAIDINFPDVPTKKIRNIALVRKMGGVGYYPTSGPRGFVHVDSGNVRQWGPAISSTEMAQIFKDGQKVVGRRFTENTAIIATNVEDQNVLGDNLAHLSKVKTQKRVPNSREQKLTSTIVTFSSPIPTPRAKPLSVLMAAAANMIIEPASAPPEITWLKKKSPVVDSLGPVTAAATILEESEVVSQGKGSFAESLRDGGTRVDVIEPMIATANANSESWWPNIVWLSPEKIMRRDGAPRTLSVDDNPLVSAAQALTPELNMPEHDINAPLVVERKGKGSLPWELSEVFQGLKKTNQL